MIVPSPSPLKIFCILTVLLSSFVCSSSHKVLLDLRGFVPRGSLSQTFILKVKSGMIIDLDTVEPYCKRVCSPHLVVIGLGSGASFPPPLRTPLRLVVHRLLFIVSPTPPPPSLNQRHAHLLALHDAPRPNAIWPCVASHGSGSNGSQSGCELPDICGFFGDNSLSATYALQDQLIL